jgi:nitrilase
MKLAAIQMNSVSDVDRNLHVAYDLMLKAVEEEGADWLLLPEHFHWAGGAIEDRRRAAELLGDGPAYEMCSRFARNHKVFIHAGSLFERSADDPRIYNTTVAFGRDGKELARYRKIHLFDIDGPDGTSFRESDTVAPGQEVVTYDADGITVGCAICYDLRFPGLFQQLTAKGAQIIALPAAFTLQTGKDHWEPLIRARAIETQTYFVASGSCGVVDYEGKPHWTYGHSMIVDPWGHIVAMTSDGPGVAAHSFDLGRLEKIRRDIPVSAYRASSATTLNNA